MIFRKKIQKSCCYCSLGTLISEDQVLCTRKGFMPLYKSCRKFHYDPCKRIPTKAKAPDFNKYTEDDFKL